MPLLAWLLVRATNWDCRWDRLSTETEGHPTAYHAVKYYFYAIALILQGCTPGGSTSNLYTCKHLP